MENSTLDQFFATSELRDEFLRFQRMTAEEKDSFGQENRERLFSMSEEAREAYNKQMLYGLQELRKEAEELFLYEKVESIAKYISLSQIAQDYFGKSRHWLYQRLKGLTVNGRPAQFTPEERRKLSEALLDISKRIQETALRIA